MTKTDTTTPADQIVARHYDAPFGPITLVAAGEGLREIRWVDQTTDDLVFGSSPTLEKVARQLDEYFAGERTEFQLELDPQGTDFQIEAWHALTEIPYGETTSYGKQAARLGRPKASRAVGAANGQNPIPIVVPCHRVVGSNGKLTGFAGGLELKSWLLEHERQQAGATLPFD